MPAAQTPSGGRRLKCWSPGKFTSRERCVYACSAFTRCAWRVPGALPSQPRGPSEAAPREAARFRIQPKQMVDQKRDSLGTSVPEIAASIDRAAWHLRQTGWARSGNPCRTRALAQRKAALTVAGGEACRVAVILALIDHEAGRYDLELRQTHNPLTP